MSRPRKNTIDLAPSTFAYKRKHGQLPWSKLFAESVQNMKNPGVPAELKVTWVLLQPILRRSQEPGYLIEDGKPMDVQNLAVDLWKSSDVLAREIDELLRFRWLKKDERGVIYDSMMKLDLENPESQGENDISYPNGYGFHTPSEEIREDQTREYESEILIKEGSDGYRSENLPKVDTDGATPSRCAEATRSSSDLAKLASDVTTEWISGLKNNPANNGKGVDAVVLRARQHKQYIDDGVVVTRKIINGWLKNEQTGKPNSGESKANTKSSSGSLTSVPQELGISNEKSEYFEELMENNPDKFKSMPPKENDQQIAKWLKANIKGDYDPYEFLYYVGKNSSCDHWCSWALRDKYQFDPQDGGDCFVTCGDDYVGGDDAYGNTRIKGSKWLR